MHIKKYIKILAIAVLVGAVGITGYIFCKNKNVSDIERLNPGAKDLQLRILSGMIYRHLIAYSLVCKDAGIELTKYPDYFSQKYKTAIQKVNHKWEDKGSSLQNILIHFDKKIYPTIAQDVAKELIDIERLTAKFILSHQNNIPVSEIVWTDELEKKLNLKDACVLLDDEASFFLDRSAFDEEFNDRLSELD